jgi:hypothetical protein
MADTHSDGSEKLPKSYTKYIIAHYLYSHIELLIQIKLYLHCWYQTRFGPHWAIISD